MSQGVVAWGNLNLVYSGTVLFHSGKTIFCILLAVYLLCAAGYIDCVDAVPSYETAKALLSRFSLQVHVPTIEGTFYGTSASGEKYSLMGFAYAFLYLPAALGALVTGKEQVGYFLVSLVNPVITAIIVLLVFQVFLAWKYSRKTSLWIAIALGFGTALFPYSKTCFREPLQALCLFLGWIAIFPEFRGKHRWLSGFAIALGILTKEVFLITALPLLCIYAWEAFKEKRTSGKLYWLLGPILASGLFWVIFHRMAWGKFGLFGHSPDVASVTGKAWSTPLVTGIAMQWLSSQDGFFLYNPLLLLSIPLLFWKWRQQKISRFDIGILATIAIQTLFYAKWYTPIGKEALGPRFLVTTIPLYFLLLRGFRPRLTKLAAWALKGFVVVCIGLQFPSVAVKMQQYWTLKARAHTTLRLPHYRANLIFFERKLLGGAETYATTRFKSEEYELIALNDAATLRGFNFWWAHLFRVRY